MRSLLASFAALILALAPAAYAERPDVPMSSLAEAPFQLEVTVLSVEEKQQTDQITNIWHRVRIERVFVASDLKIGDETAVVSSRVTLPPRTAGSTGDRGPFNGPGGLPMKGDRARIFARGSAKILQTIPPNGWQLPARAIAFVATDDEYRSDITMPFIAKLVERAQIARTIVLFATSDDGTGSSAKVADMKARTGLTDDWQHSRVDASVLSMRQSQLGYNQTLSFVRATRHGLPLVGFRTSLQAFGYSGDGKHAKWWNEQFPFESWGTRWKSHCGQKSKTRILPPDAEAAKHPVLAGVSIAAEGIVVPSWLYQVDPLPPDCRVLLWGEAIDGECPAAAQRQPILWVREKPRKEGLPSQRIAFTTLGHPADFVDTEVRLLSVQMIAWALGEEARMDDAARAAIRSAQYLPPEVHLAGSTEP